MSNSTKNAGLWQSSGMNRLPILAAIAVLSVSTTAHAEQWWVASFDDDGAMLVETDSIATSSTGTRRVWTASIYATPQTIGAASGVYVSRRLFEVDCKEGRFRYLQATHLKKDLVTVGNHNQSVPVWTYAAPGTLGLTIQQTACNGIGDNSMVGPIATLQNGVDGYFRVLAARNAKR